MILFRVFLHENKIVQTNGSFLAFFVFDITDEIDPTIAPFSAYTLVFISNTFILWATRGSEPWTFKQNPEAQFSLKSFKQQHSTLKITAMSD